MDRLFLAGLNESRRARSDNTVARSESRRISNPRILIPGDPSFSDSDRSHGTSPHPLASPQPSHLSPSALYAASTAAPGSAGLAGLGTFIAAPYGGRPPEQLLFDATTCDLVLLVADQVSYARAIPVHREVLRTRNAGGYFARLLASPGQFTEYSERAAGAGAEDAAGPLASKPMIRRMQWPWAVAAALVCFLYRDSCEVGWAQLPELRAVAEEVGCRELLEAIDQLVDPQSLLPWSVDQLRAAGEALSRQQLLEAADRYTELMQSAGVDESTDMTGIVYVTWQRRHKVSMAAATGVSCPTGPAASGGNSSYAAAYTSRDNRLGFDIVDGVFRSVSADSRTLRMMLQAGRRRDHVTLYRAPGSQTGGGGGGTESAFAAAAAAPQQQQLLVRRRSSMAFSGLGLGLGSGGSAGSGAGSPLRPSSPYGVRPAPPPAPTAPLPWLVTAPPPSRASMELPRLGSRIKTALGIGSVGGGGGGGGVAGPMVSSSGRSLSSSNINTSFSFSNVGGGGGAGAVAAVAAVAGPDSCGSSGGFAEAAAAADLQDPSDLLELLVAVPASETSAALAGLVARPLSSHMPAPASSGKKDQVGPSFDPFSRLTGVPGISWADSRGGGGGAAAGGAAMSLLQQLPATTSLGNCDRITLALAPDLSGGGAGGSSAGGTLTSPLTSPSEAGAAAALVGRLLGSVLSTLAATDASHFIVRMDAASAAQAVAFERRRSTVDMSSLANIAEVMAGGGGGGGGGGGFPAASGASFTGGNGASFSAAAGGTPCVAKAVIGPASPREFFIPLPDNPAGALTVSLPVGLVLVDPALLETITSYSAAAAVGPAVGSAVAPAGYRRSSTLGYSSSSGYLGPAGGGGGGLESRPSTVMGFSGGGGTSSSSPRLAALVPHLLATSAAIGGLIASLNAITQVLRVTSEQHMQAGALPSSLPMPLPLRASLRICNPSKAMLTVLEETHTNFAVEACGGTIYVRKSPQELVRLLQALQSTLPVRSRSSVSNLSGNELMPSPSMTGRSLMAAVTSTSGRSEPPLCGLARQESLRSRSFLEAGSRSRRSLDVPRASLTSGGLPYGHGVPYESLDRLFPGSYLRVVELSPQGTPVEEF